MNKIDRLGTQVICHVFIRSKSRAIIVLDVERKDLREERIELNGVTGLHETRIVGLQI